MHPRIRRDDHSLSRNRRALAFNAACCSSNANLNLSAQGDQLGCRARNREELTDPPAVEADGTITVAQNGPRTERLVLPDRDVLGHLAFDLGDERLAHAPR